MLSSAGFQKTLQYIELFKQGVICTVSLSALTVFFGFILAMIIAIIRVAKLHPFDYIASAYVEVFRATPMLVQLFIVYYVVFGNVNLPQFKILGFIRFERFLPGVVALAMNSGAYLSEIITSRLEEIIHALLWYVQESGLGDKLGGGIVVTGGAAAMPNLSSLIGELSGMTVRIGYPRRKYSAAGCPGVDETSAATSIAMILAGKELEYLNCLDEAPREEEEIIPEEEPVIEPDEDTAEEENKDVSFIDQGETVEEEDGDEVPEEIFRPEEVEASKEEKERIKAQKAAEKAERKAREAEARAERRRQKIEEQKQKEADRKKRQEEAISKFGIVRWFQEKLDNLYDETSDF